MPGEAAFEMFESLPKSLYPEGSWRERTGHEVATKHLKSCYVMLRNGSPVARFALYLNPDLKYEGMTTACIGSFETDSDVDGAQALIAVAKSCARNLGVEYLIGPMEGSTWNSHRFSAHNDAAPFFMEPYHHEHYNQAFEGAAFDVIGNYVSNLNETLQYDAPALAEYESKLAEKGGRVSPLNKDNFEQDIRRIGALSIEAFKDNFLYTAITVDEFAEKYLPLKNYMIPELVWMIENTDGEIQAIMFGVQDYFDTSGKTFIIKSLARKKDTPFRGAGSYLVDKVTQAAIELGFTRVIHAMIFEENVSKKMSQNYAGREYKRYRLYGTIL
jgi:L-amino acid N-acyltransferase YncA